MYRIEEIQLLRRIMSEKLDPRRYEHSLGVSFTAAALAMAHGADISQAEMAGMVHDCAKRFPPSVLVEKCRRHGIVLSEDQLRSPAVIHAIYGAYLTEKKYGITDRDVINAVRYHTTGRPGMSKLEKIVYVADYIEPQRSLAQILPEMRRLAFSDLDECMYRILKDTVAFLKGKKSYIARDTFDALDYFSNLLGYGEENGKN